MNATAPTIGQLVKVVVNATSPRTGGGLSFITRELAALNSLQDLDLQLLTSPWNHEILVSLGIPTRRVPVPNAAARYLWEQMSAVRGRQNALLYAPANFGPILPTPGPVVVTVQNANLVGAGRQLPHNQSFSRKAKSYLSRQSLTRATAVVAISHSLAAAIREDLPQIDDRLFVIPSGASDRPPVRTMHDDYSQIPEGQYFLTVGHEYPHKRVHLVLEAWAEAFRRHSQPPHLVVVGEISDATRAWANNVQPAGLRGRLHLLGTVEDEGRVSSLMSGAIALVSASILEAFPLTPIEAESVGTPCILSEIPAHREVTQGAAIYFQPDAKADLRRALREAWLAPPVPPTVRWPTTWVDHAVQLRDVFAFAVETGN